MRHVKMHFAVTAEILIIIIAKVGKVNILMFLWRVYLYNATTVL